MVTFYFPPGLHKDNYFSQFDFRFIVRCMIRAIRNHNFSKISLTFLLIAIFGLMSLSAAAQSGRHPITGTTPGTTPSKTSGSTSGADEDKSREENPILRV